MIILLSIGGLLVAAALVVIFFFGSLFVNLFLHEAQSKDAMTTEISALPLPAGCKEKSRAYTREYIGSPASWTVHYDCDTTGGAAYGTITAGIKHRGYSMATDTTTPDHAVEGLHYFFDYRSSLYEVIYSFDPGFFTNQPNTPETLPTLHVTGIELTIEHKQG